MSKEKAYCVVNRPRLFSTVEEALKSVVVDELKLDDLVVCVALGSPEAKFKVRKGVFPFGVAKTIPKGGLKTKPSNPTQIIIEEAPEYVPGELSIEPCTFCAKPSVKTFFDAEKQPFKVCNTHLSLGSKV